MLILLRLGYKGTARFVATIQSGKWWPIPNAVNSRARADSHQTAWCLRRKYILRKFCLPTEDQDLSLAREAL